MSTLLWVVLATADPVKERTPPEPPKPLAGKGSGAAPSAKAAKPLLETAAPKAAAKPAGDSAPTNQWLRTYDKNHDGRLSPDEVPARLQKKFVRADVNGDGLLDANELLYGRTRLSIEARKAENLRLAGGKLVQRGLGANHEELIAGGMDVLRQLDADQDGELTSAEVQRFIEGFGLQVPAEGLPPFRLPLSLPGVALSPLDPPGDDPPGDDADPQSQEGAPPSAPLPLQDQKGDGLPDANAILANLDKNHDGVLEPNEAVDRLAQNFKMLDKDKSGTLNKSEIERGLRLAKLFGVKPQRNPLEYKAKNVPTPPKPEPPLKEEEPSPRKI